MIYESPSWLGQLPTIPDNITAGDFATNQFENFYTADTNRPVLVDAASGRSYDIDEVKARVELLARALAHELQWKPDVGNPADKVIGLFSLNAIDFMIVCWAIHRIGGTCLLLHATASAAELQGHLKNAGCHVIFTNPHLMPIVDQAKVFDDSRMYLLDCGVATDGSSASSYPMSTVEHLVGIGKACPALKALSLNAGQNKELIAYLCPTSGTSGMQKLARLSHYNVISNCMMTALHENAAKKGQTEVSLGVLPLSHAYTLIVGHLCVWRGDCFVLHARFDFQECLTSVHRYQIQRLYLVPSIIQAFIKNHFILEMFDLSTVDTVVTGSACFSKAMGEALREIKPKWEILSGYGLTECGVIMSLSGSGNALTGSEGCLLKSVQARLLSEDGTEIHGFGIPGELLLKSPSIMPGYHGDPAANKTIFDAEGWLRTGDIAMFKQDRKGSSHLFIVDRKKDIMKVKGMQIAPAEIEAHLLMHPIVAETAVVAVPDEDAGERPHAFIVRSPKVMAEVADKEAKDMIRIHIESNMSEPHWLKNNITLIEAIPKSHSGKALKFKLKEIAKKS